MNQKLMTLFVVIGGVILVSGQALAEGGEQSGWYFGLSFGNSDLDACKGLGGLGVTVCDDSDTGVKIFSGYQFTENWGLEGGYAELGEAVVQGSISGASFSATADVTGVEFLGTGTVPITEKFLLLGKAGLFVWDVDANATLGTTSATFSDDGTDFTFGIGIEYDFFDIAGIRAEYQFYDEIDVTFISVSFIYKF